MSAATRDPFKLFGMPTVGVTGYVRIYRGGDSKRRVRVYPARVHTVHEHSRVAHARVILGAPKADAVRVRFAERLHSRECAYCGPKFAFAGYASEASA